MAQQLMNLRSMRMWVQSLVLLSRLRIQCCCELWCRLVAVAPIGLPAWELLYAEGVALRKKKKFNITNHYGNANQNQNEGIPIILFPSFPVEMNPTRMHEDLGSI